MIDWIIQHYDEVFEAIGYLVTACTILVKLTPTQKDDAVLAKFVKILDVFSVVNPNGTRVVKKGGEKDGD